MHVKRLSIENQRIPEDSPELSISNPSWEEIEDSIRKLDGKYRTIVIIGQTEPEFDYMVIGDGNAGVYCCDVYDKTGREFSVVDLLKSPKEYIRVCIGQPTSVPLRETIGLDLVLVAAKKYAETGELAKELTWEGR